VNRIFISLIIFSTIGFSTKAQNGYFQQGEFGFSVGMAHYFGDLNTSAGLNKPKPAIGLFFRKQFGDYIGMRVSGRFAQLGYSDIYSKNEYQKTRNLSFNSNIFEFAVQGDFNFFKYIPNNLDFGFTPYVTLGVGLFSFDPYTMYDGEKYYLQQLGTEGQNFGYLGRQPYSLMAICIPLGVGIKYSVNQKVNLSFEITQRFTTTDYLDDVSTTFAPNYRTTNSADPNVPDCFPTDQPAGPGGQYIPSTGYILQDRSDEIVGDNSRLSNVLGRQRGWSKQKDQYLIAEIGISFNIGSYRCPTAN
jgi:hypothetical protein